MGYFDPNSAQTQRVDKARQKQTKLQLLFALLPCRVLTVVPGCCSNWWNREAVVFCVLEVAGSVALGHEWVDELPPNAQQSLLSECAKRAHRPGVIAHGRVAAMA
jgi:hypothetical protein